MLKIINIVILVVAFIVLSTCETSKSPNNKIKKIALLQFGTHPVIDEVVNGFTSNIKENFQDSVEITIYNGNFDLATISILSKQMIASKPDILVSVTTPATSQLIGANLGQFPHVFTFVSNPEDVGYVREVGIKNTTGLSDQVDYDRSLNLIRSLMPKAKKIGYLVTRSESNALEILSGFQNVTKKYGFEIVTSTIGHSTDIRIAAQSLAPKVDLFLFGGDNNIASAIDVLISVAQVYSVPTFACDAQSIARGALAGYSVDYYFMGERTVEICKDILNGKNPDLIPIQIFNSSKKIINIKMAKELAIEIPDSLLEGAKIINQ